MNYAQHLLDKERSLRGCMAAAWTDGVRRWRIWLRPLWVMLALYGLTGAFALELTIRYACLHILPALRLYQTGGDAAVVRYFLIPSLAEALSLAGAWIFFGVVAYAEWGRFVRTLQAYDRAGNTDALRLFPFTGEERRAALRALRTDVAATLAALLLLCLVLVAALKFTPWLGLITLPVLVFFWSAGPIARTAHSTLGLPYAASLRTACRQSFGPVWVVRFITAFPVGATLLIFGLWPLTYALASWAGYDSLLRGDATGLPAGLPVLFIFLNALSLACIRAAAHYAGLALTLCLAGRLRKGAAN